MQYFVEYLENDPSVAHFQTRQPTKKVIVSS